MASPMFNFQGKRVLVTGAASGIGKALSKTLLSAGATVLALDKIKEALDKLKSESPEVITVCADLTDCDETKKAVESVLPIDMLVNNAGVTKLQPFVDVDPKTFDFIMSINVKAMINVSQVVAKSLIERKSKGAIVNISSQASVKTLKDHTVYCASKAAVDQVTRMMAFELGQHQIRVNAINPTVVMTDMGRQAWSDPKIAGPALARIPLGRFAEESDIMGPVLFLLSDGASMVNGACLPVDGGYTIS